MRLPDTATLLDRGDRHVSLLSQATGAMPTDDLFRGFMSNRPFHRLLQYCEFKVENILESKSIL